MKKVEISYSHPYEDHEVGDKDTVDALEAKRLVRAGMAMYVAASTKQPAETPSPAQS